MENASGTAALSYLILTCLLWTVPTFSFFWKPYICTACEKHDASRSSLESQVGNTKMYFYDVHHFSPPFTLILITRTALMLLSYSSIWSDNTRYFSFPEKWKKSLTGELSLLQRWSIVKSIIRCLFQSTCKEVSKSLSSQKTPTQTSCSFQFDQLFFL